MKYSITKLTKTSNENINYIFEHYSSKLKFIINDTYFIKLLYTLIDKAIETPIEHSLKQTESNGNIINSSFCSQEIKDYIKNNTFIIYNIEFKIKDAQYNLFIYSKKKIQIDKYIYFIKLILGMCSEQATTHNNVFTFKIFLTDFKKTQPTIPVTPFHINSGVTSYPSDPHENDCKDIIIFRNEEWFKVFIHECFHLFCLDFCDVDVSKFKNLFKQMYNIEGEFLFFEALTEFWARTINIAVVSYSTKKNILYEEFETLMKINIQIERLYSILQMKHILSNMGFTYESLLDKTRTTLFKEETNFFCYYVLTTLLLFHYEQTIAWFVEHNQTILQFSKNKNSVLLFFYYIKSIHKNVNMLKTFESLDKFELTNNYMSVFEILL
uniref:Peptidase M61 catalytic domain-containing protein n=1 Tax=viral metagenome TaxID=1070528 RepID=A0A6C0JKX8_9ZZZZ